MRSRFFRFVFFEAIGVSLFLVFYTLGMPYEEFVLRAPALPEKVTLVLVTVSLLFVSQALLFRNSYIKSRKWARSLDILFSDFGFESYVTFNFISFVFALTQALVLSSYCTASVLLWTFWRYGNNVYSPGGGYYTLALLSIPVMGLIFLFILLLIRSSLEAYVLVFKASLALQSIASKESIQKKPAE